MRIWINIKKVLIIFLSLFIVFFSLSAPYSTRNIDKLAYVLALGLDIGNSNTLKLSVQLAKPSNGSNGSSGTAYEKIVNSVECASIETGISPVSYTHLTLPTIAAECRSRWSPYH